MIENIESEHICFICYNLIENKNPSVLEKCNNQVPLTCPVEIMLEKYPKYHKFCKTCVVRMLFQTDVTCPLDRVIMNNIIVGVGNGSIIKHNVEEYQRRYLEDKWVACLPRCKDGYQMLLNFLCEIENRIDILILQKRSIKRSDFKNLKLFKETFICEFDKFTFELKTYNELFQFIRDILQIDCPPMKDSYKMRLLNDCQKVSNILTALFSNSPCKNILEFENRHSNRRKFIEENFQKVKSEIFHLKSIIAYMEDVTVFKVDENNQKLNQIYC